MAAPAGPGEMVIFGWLARIGLEHAVPMFQAEGVTSPAALASLKTEDYDRLGINNDDEKRRLSELVGRVRQVCAVRRFLLNFVALACPSFVTCCLLRYLPLCRRLFRKAASPWRRLRCPASRPKSLLRRLLALSLPQRVRLHLQLCQRQRTTKTMEQPALFQFRLRVRLLPPFVAAFPRVSPSPTASTSQPWLTIGGGPWPRPLRLPLPTHRRQLQP